ncbi:hypothetical protein [Streptomyces sp. NBC_01455]|uniref:hypothetical protein n=1 Tax=Streptomyces sp. NBC_01455 TaxID=2903874 RepID=UPI003FCCD450
MKTLLTGGIVVSMDPAVGDLHRGDVLIEDGVIVEVAERVDAPDAEVIDATDRIVMPGFVDNHRHTWQTAFRGVGADWTFPEWAVAMHGTVKPQRRVQVPPIRRGRPGTGHSSSVASGSRGGRRTSGRLGSRREYWPSIAPPAAHLGRRRLTS